MFFPLLCLNVEEDRNCRSFINALLHCGLNLQQMGQDTLANIQCEPADLHWASLFKDWKRHWVQWSSWNVIPAVSEAESQSLCLGEKGWACGCGHTWMCLLMDVFWTDSWMWHLLCGLGNAETAFLTLIILYASNFSTISAPYQCFSSFHDTTAEIIMIEAERIMLQKPTCCCHWIFVLLQPAEIMVWAACTALKPISVCRNIIKEWHNVHSIKVEFRRKKIKETF